MASFLVDGRFPPVLLSPSNDITSEERSTAIDFVNRRNPIFQESYYDKMTATFLPGAVVYHSHGTIRGHAEFKQFLENVYGFFIPGIGRSATNHVVDRDENGGVVVTCCCWARIVKADGLPAIWWFGQVVDRLSIIADGWRILERYLGGSFRKHSWN
ncbi:uncharacterized protein BDW70DRAFT_152867 [Aspergillus foveolatus]|uniref:uncharacterized protein n=1 Tax=Aspergillus foveolatus TaxID=210207 RepID=UPI003CCCD4D0